jgi:TonB family protein
MAQGMHVLSSSQLSLQQSSPPRDNSGFARGLSRLIVRTALIYLVLGSCVWLTGSATAGQTTQRPVSIAILDFGNSIAAQHSTDALVHALLSEATGEQVQLVDRDLSRVAARGAGYSRSLNLSLPEARDLGAAIGCDFYILGDAQTLRRSPSTGSIYFESYASLFLVSARTGKLISWDRPSFQAAKAEAAEKLLLAELNGNEIRQRYLLAIRRSLADERRDREVAIERNTPVIEEAPDDAKADASGLQLPRPYRRLRPSYPDTAARADAEGTVDVLVDLDKEGEVSHVEVARWAGFGMDQAALETAQQLHFFPALRDGAPIPMRVLLRYNFRRPASESKR